MLGAVVAQSVTWVHVVIYRKRSGCWRGASTQPELYRGATEQGTSGSASTLQTHQCGSSP